MSAVPMMSVVVNLAMSILPRFGRYAPAPIAEAIALHRRCVNASGPQGSPRRVRSVERGRYFALVDAGQVDRPQVRGAAAALTGTEIHDHAPIGRSEERRVGNGCVRTLRFRGWP